MRRLVTVYDVRKSIKPTMTEGQIHGGAGMAIGAAVMEQHYGFYPSMDYRPATLGEYIISTTLGVPDVEAHIYECPSPEGRMGPKVSAR